MHWSIERWTWYSRHTVARILNLASSTVSFIVRRWQNTGSTNTFKRSGRPKMITTRGARQLKSIVKHNRRNTLRGITEIYNDAKYQRVSSKTVSRALHKMGFWARRPCKKPLVSRTNKKKRLAFFHKHKTWGIKQWKNVVYSDESKFNLLNSDGRIRVWREKGSVISPECANKSIRGGGGSVMFWGCISFNMMGPLIEVKQTMDAKS